MPSFLKTNQHNSNPQSLIPYSLLSTSYFLLVLFIAIIALFPLTVHAQEETNYDQINEVAKELNCPTCVGINLADCQTQTCAQWRDQIGDLLAQGYTKQEVLNYFETQYGTRVLMEPPPEGSTLILWMLPVVALLLGGGWLAYTLRRWHKPAPVATTPNSQISRAPAGAASDDYLDQVDRDLKAT